MGNEVRVENKDNKLINSTFNQTIYIGGKKIEIECDKDRFLTRNSIHFLGKFKIFGRDKDLENIKNIFSEGTDIIHIYGVAGIGKSLFVKRFIQYAMENKLFDCFGYVSFSSLENKENSSYIELLKQTFISEFNIEGDIKDFNQLIYILKNIENNGKKLIVLDDLANLEKISNGFLNELFSLTSKNYYFIITSRESERVSSEFDIDIEEYRLDELKEEDLKTLFFSECKNCKKLAEKNKNFDEILNKVLDELDKNTLLVKVLGKYLGSIRIRKSKQEELLRLLAIYNKLKEETISQALNSKDIENKAYKLFDFIELRNDDNKFLKKLTTLPPESISFDEIFNLYFIKKLKNDRYNCDFIIYPELRFKKDKTIKDLTKPKDNFSAYLEHMERKGFLTLTYFDDVEDISTELKIHKIVRDYILDVKKPKYKDIQFQVEAFSLHLPRYNIYVYEKNKDISNYVGKILVLDRTIRNLEDVKDGRIFKRGFKKGEKTFSKDKILDNTLINLIKFYIKGAGVLRHLKLFDESKRFLEFVERILKETGCIDENYSILTKDLKEKELIADFFTNYGNYLRDKANPDFKNSAKFLKEASEILKELGNKDRLKGIYGSLSRTYKFLNNSENSIKYAKKALEITKETYGDKHPEIAKAYGNLATIYKSIGDYNNALNYSLKASKITEIAYGTNHPETAKAYSNLASIYKEKKELNRALSYYEKALDIFKEFFGKEHIIYKNVNREYLLLKLILEGHENLDKEEKKFLL